ncbi:MAG: DUF2852 domain-containing protein [Silicimonas sp.]|nr:DUF2852 domain-containing protein [Silicimonas sp.]
MTANPARRDNWLRRSERWLDERGKPAWIVAMVLGFVFFWPIGLALLGYMIWSNRMFSGNCSRRTRHAANAFKSSGNTAFDAYKAETLRRLQDEQDAFEAFLQRLRDAKDKAEFDQFMEDRARKKNEDTIDGEAEPA